MSWNGLKLKASSDELWDGGITDEQDEEYWVLLELARERFRDLADLVYRGQISREEFIRRMKELVKEHYIDIAVLARGDRGFSPEDVSDLKYFIGVNWSLLDSFEENISSNDYSNSYLAWRASLYSNNRHNFLRFAMPRSLFLSLPEFPGVSCLGDGACGCKLEWSIVGTTAEVYWILNPVKDHCSVCVALAASWIPLRVELSEWT